MHAEGVDVKLDLGDGARSFPQMSEDSEARMSVRGRKINLITSVEERKESSKTCLETHEVIKI